MLINQTASFIFLIVLLNTLLTESAKHILLLMVSLHLKNGPHVCGGSLVNDLWVLSASHCITLRVENATLRNPDDFIIIAGLTNLTKIIEHGQSRQIGTFIEHPNFSRPLLYNDITLIKVKTPFILNNMVQPVKLPIYQELQGIDLLFRYKVCMALGWRVQKPQSGEKWDNLTDQDTIAVTLIQVNLPIISIYKCMNVFNDWMITYRHVCTMSPYEGKDACKRDGSPLICGNLQYGITSWGHACAVPGTPGVFTRVDMFDEWINNVITGEANFISE